MARRRADVLGVCAVAVLLIGWWLKTRVMFPQVEFVDWIASPARPMMEDGVRAMVTFREDAFSRHTSLIWASIIGRACGTDITCVNTLAFAPVAVAAFAVYAFARTIRLAAAVAVAIVAVWLISRPTFEILTWQATLHDRLAAAFVPVLLGAVLWVVRRPSWHPAAALAVSLALAGFSLLTVNTKEPAWVVVPMVAAAPWLFGRDRRHTTVIAATLLPAVLVMTVHVVTDWRAISNDPVSSGHVGGGSVVDNIPALTDHVVPGGLWLFVPLVLMATAGAVIGLRRRSEFPDAAEAARYAIWLSIGAVGGWIIPARTQFASPFYMFVPIFMAGLAFASGARALLLVHPPRPGIPRATALIAAALLVAVCTGVAASSRWDEFGMILRHDERFRASLPQIADVHRRESQATFQFNTPAHIGYRFVTASQAARFWRFVSPVINPGDWSSPIGSIAEGCGPPGMFVLSYDAQSRFVRACTTPAPVAHR